MTKVQIQNLIILIEKYAKEQKLVPAGHQLYVNLDLKPVPPIPLVVISGTMPELPNIRLDTLNLGTRIIRALRKYQVTTVSDLITKVKEHGSTDELLRVPNFGKKALKELTERLESEGYVLGPQW